MDLFTQIKMAVSVKEAAEYYGLEVNRGNMVCCPFHNDRTPSMKLNEDYFYCFGCGASGDVIDLAARLFGLSGYDAAKKLAADFGVAVQKPSVLAKLQRGKSQAETERRCFRVLGDYLRILQDWKENCAPQSPEDAIDPRYAEACHMLCLLYTSSAACSSVIFLPLCAALLPERRIKSIRRQRSVPTISRKSSVFIRLTSVS